jgi:hypothetical protein
MTAVAHGFEALVKPCNRKPTRCGIAERQTVCRGRLGVGDTITLTKLRALYVPHTKEC